MGTDFIKVSGVSKTLGDQDDPREVVKDCSFSAERGKLTVLIGPSGCGKTTLIRLIAGFSRPTAGEISVDGQRVSGPGVDRLVVFQETALFPWMTTDQNIAYGPSVRGVDKTKARAAVEAIRRKVGLQAFAEKFPAQLSGGMQRRAELARAMINDPKIMILDEPFRGLDAMSKELMWKYYETLYMDGESTHLFVTTDIDEAIFLADRILIMSNRPMRLRESIDIELERPRSIAMLVEDERANKYKLDALTILHEEAMRAFSGGSEAAADFVQAYARRFGRSAAG